MDVGGGEQADILVENLIWGALRDLTGISDAFILEKDTSGVENFNLEGDRIPREAILL